MLDPSNTSVYGEFHKLDRTPFLLSTNDEVLSADLPDNIFQATFVHREGDGLRFAFNPSRKWEYRTKVKQTDLHTFTVTVSINRVIVMSQPVQPFRIIPIAKTNAGGGGDCEEKRIAGHSLGSAAPSSSRKNATLATTPQDNSHEMLQAKFDKRANSSVKKRRMLRDAFFTTLQEQDENEAVARISEQSTVLQAHNRSSPTPSMAMGLRGSPSMSLMFPMGAPSMEYMPDPSETGGGPIQTDYTFPSTLSPQIMSALQLRGLSYTLYNSLPNSMMGVQQFDYAPKRMINNVIQLPGGWPMSIPPRITQIGSQQQTTSSSSSPFFAI